MNGPTPGMVREQVGKGLDVELRLRGRSMLPLLPPGVVLVLRATRPGDLRPGALVVFERAGRLICHRIESAAGDGADARLTTRGTFLPHADAPLTPAALVATVVGLRIGKRVVPIDGPAFATWARVILPSTALLAATAAIASRTLPAWLRGWWVRKLHL